MNPCQFIYMLHSRKLKLLHITYQIYAKETETVVGQFLWEITITLISSRMHINVNDFLAVEHAHAQKKQPSLQYAVNY